MITFAEIRKSFDDFSLAINDINLSPGHVYGLVGHNGAGKSTFLKIAAGLISPDIMTVALNGKFLTTPLALRQNIAYVPDKPALYDWMTVRAFAEFCAKANIGASSEILETLNRFKVPLDKRIQHLSHGNRSKVGLAIAFSRPASYILMDEPLTGLDMQSRAELLDQIEVLARRPNNPKAVLFSTHTMADLETIAEKIFIFRKGTCVLTSTMEEIRSNWMVIEPTREAQEVSDPLPKPSKPTQTLVLRSSLDSQDSLDATYRPANSLDVFLLLG